MKINLRKISLLLLLAVLICSVPSVRAEAGFEIPGTCQVYVDAGDVCAVKTLDHDYGNNTYLSLRDMAMAFRGTDKSFSLEISKNAVSMNLGESYVPVGGENVPWEGSETVEASVRRNECKVNGQDTFYYTLIQKLPSGYYDCFMMAADLAMILDVGVTVSAGDSLEIHTQESFRVSPAALEEAGYFCGVNSALVGDASTGELYYRYHSGTSYPIASITKLMTCLLTLEAISSGQLALEDSVVISDAVQALAASDDGVLPLEAGGQITLRELLYGALLPSSNESALCLAETVAGSEDDFVRRMNQKAQDLGLAQAVFYNSHGLPSYTEDPVPAKRQNRMSAEELFRLVSYLLKVYPQITDITSTKTADLPSLGLEVRNTNPLLYNLPEATGLKTGTTNKAGACLVTSLTADDGAMEHDLVVIVLGAEDSIERGRVSGLLARYALYAFEAGAEKTEAVPSDRGPGSLPTHAEAAVDCILRKARDSAPYPDLMNSFD